MDQPAQNLANQTASFDKVENRPDPEKELRADTTAADILKEAAATINEPDTKARRQKYLLRRMVELEAEAWQHDIEADYALEGLTPVQEKINDNNIAIARHEEIIQSIENDPEGHRRERREAKKQSLEDVKILQQHNKDLQRMQADIKKISEGRKAKAVESLLHLKFVANVYKAEFLKGQ